MVAQNVLTYTATITTPTGALYSFTGAQSIVTLNTAGFAAATAAMQADIQNQLVNGTANDPSVAAQQQIDVSQG